MAAKCNITGLVLQKLNTLYYGMKCSRTNVSAIAENYVEYLNCPTVTITICNEEVCENPPILFDCNVRLLSITKLPPDEGDTADLYVTYTVNNSNILGGTPPLTYLWNFEEDDFTAASAINEDTLVLRVRDGKLLSEIVSEVTVEITDANGCTDSKSCWLDKGSINCSRNFVPCVTPSNLIINNPVTYCVAPGNLIVT